MKKPVALLCLAALPVVHADPGIDCSVPFETLDYSEQKVCTHRALMEAEKEYEALMDRLRGLLEKRIALEREDPGRWKVGWGVSTEAGLASIEESDVLWRRLHEIDCSIEIDSPAWAGGAGAPHAGNGCRLERYEDRVEQVRRFMEAWQLHLAVDES